MQIIDIKNRKDLILVTDSQEVEAVKQALPKKAAKYDSFFVRVDEGEYSEVFGFIGIIPNYNKQLYKIL